MPALGKPCCSAQYSWCTSVCAYVSLVTALLFL